MLEEQKHWSHSAWVWSSLGPSLRLYHECQCSPLLPITRKSYDPEEPKKQSVEVKSDRRSTQWSFMSTTALHLSHTLSPCQHHWLSGRVRIDGKVASSHLPLRPSINCLKKSWESIRLHRSTPCDRNAQSDDISQIFFASATVENSTAVSQKN